MTYELVASRIIREQVEKLPRKYKKQIDKKIDLIKQNPFRFKAVHSKLYSRVFRIRMKIEGKEMRLVYVVLGSKIIIVGILDRSKEYRDLEAYLSKL